MLSAASYEIGISIKNLAHAARLGKATSLEFAGWETFGPGSWSIDAVTVYLAGCNEAVVGRLACSFGSLDVCADGNKE